MGYCTVLPIQEGCKYNPSFHQYVSFCDSFDRWWVWDCDSKDLKLQQTSSAAKNRIKGRTWTSNMLGHCLQAEQQLPAFCCEGSSLSDTAMNIPWHALYSCWLLSTQATSLHFWSRHWKPANHFLQRWRADRADSFFWPFHPQHFRGWCNIAPKRTFSGIIVWRVGFLKKMTQQSMMLLCVFGHF